MRKAKYDEKIIKMLEKSGGMKASTVAAQLGVRPTTIYKVLTRMLEQGRVVKEGLIFRSASKEEAIAELFTKEASKEPNSKVAWTVVSRELEHEIGEIGREIGQLTQEMNILREIQHRLTSILERAR